MQDWLADSGLLRHVLDLVRHEREHVAHPAAAAAAATSTTTATADGAAGDAERRA